jgi:hypothetical protein
VGLFRRKASSATRKNARTDGDGEFSLDAQDQMSEIMDAFHEHDAAGLARLTATERADQLRARTMLQHYLDALWEEPKQRAVHLGLDSAEAHPANDPSFSCVADLLGLAHQLVAEVEEAQANAGDDTDEPVQENLLPSDRFEPYTDQD